MTKDDLKKGQRLSDRNPKTGTEVPTSRMVVFKPSASLNSGSIAITWRRYEAISDPDAEITDKRQEWI